MDYDIEEVAKRALAQAGGSFRSLSVAMRRNVIDTARGMLMAGKSEDEIVDLFRRKLPTWTRTP